MVAVISAVALLFLGIYFFFPRDLNQFPYFGSSDLHTETYTPLGGNRYLEYRDGDPPFYKITRKMQQQSDKIATNRKKHVKNAMIHAWNGYKTYAYGADEVHPISGHPEFLKWGGNAVTMIDSLDALWIMDMKEEFYEAAQWIEDNLNFNHPTLPVSVLETTIRALGGLLLHCRDQLQIIPPQAQKPTGTLTAKLASNISHLSR